MLQERIEARWINAFAETFALCGVKAGDTAAVLSETQSRAINVQLAELALLRLGAKVFHLVLASPKSNAPVPVRSTGASDSIQGLSPVINALSATTFVADITVEGLLHAPELPQILAGGARVLMVSNEHPEVLERCLPDPALEPKVKAGMKRLRGAKVMQVSSAAGTDVRIQMAGSVVGGGWGYTARPGTISHWPGGICLAFPAAGSVNGVFAAPYAKVAAVSLRPASVLRTYSAKPMSAHTLLCVLPQWPRWRSERRVSASSSLAADLPISFVHASSRIACARAVLPNQ